MFVKKFEDASPSLLVAHEYHAGSQTLVRPIYLFVHLFIYVYVCLWFIELKMDDVYICIINT